VWEAIDLDGDDFATSPWEYPGRPPALSGLLTGDGFRAIPDAWRSDRRHAVCAIGSNRSPAVVQRKFATGHVSTTVPFLRGRLHGIGVGHSPHVSAAGYIAAAPYAAADAVSDVVVLLLDDEQRECLDGSEPNYLVTTLHTHACRLALLDRDEGVGRLAEYDVYVSRWGVLAPPEADPLPLQSQPALFERLAGSCPGFADVVGTADPRLAMRRLADDADLRHQTTQALADAGWAADGGLTPSGGGSPR
jgi:hypothetical protein